MPPETLIDSGSEVQGALPVHEFRDLLRQLRADLPQLSRSQDIKDAELEAGSIAAGQTEIDVYLDTDEEDAATATFVAIDELAEALGLADTELTELRRGSFIRRSKASVRTGLSDVAFQQRLQSLERFIELWQVDPRQAEIDQRTSEAFARMINCLENIPSTTTACR